MLGKYLKRHRLKENLSQSEMAALIGTSQAYYSQIESGARTPGIRMIRRISEAIGVEASTLRDML